MKNRSRPFQCAIADTVVAITLRHGGGLGEPDNVYVRCDERDCQHVDLNQPPCPLRIDLFADGSDRLTGEYLASHPAERVCYACLTRVLGITHDQVRRASWRLKDDPGFSIRPARCMVCRRRRVTIALDGDVAVPLSSTPFPRSPEPAARRTKRAIPYEEPGALDAPRRVIDLLVRSAGAGLCPACVAFSTVLPLADTRRILQTFAGPEFVREEAACGACGRWQTVVRLPAVPTAQARAWIDKQVP